MTKIINKDRTAHENARKQQYVGVDFVTDKTDTGFTYYVKSGTNRIKVGEYIEAQGIYVLDAHDTLIQHIFNSITATVGNGGVHDIKFDGTSLKVYYNNAWVTVGTTTPGDVTGPAGATNNNIAVYDGVTGKIIKDGAATIAQVRDRSTHTGTQAAVTISDFDTEVSNNTDVAANTTHRGSSANPHTTSDANLSTSDITINNASTAKHGFLKKLNNDATYYMDGTGAWSVPAGGGGGSTDGWISAAETWTYVSATSFKVSGDVTGKYGKGDKIKWTQNGTVRQNNIIADPSYASGPNETTITIHVGYISAAGDCAVLDTGTYPITDNYYSKMDNPQGFPCVFNWTPTITGYSSVPSGGIYRFNMNNCKVRIDIREPSDGTSNASSITISLPITAKTVTNMYWLGSGYVRNNTANDDDHIALIQILSAATSMSIFRYWSFNNTFTTSGGKRLASGNVEYEA